MFWKKSKPAKSAPAKRPEPLIRVKGIDDLHNWRTRKPFEGDRTQMAFGTREGGLSAAVVPARQGEVFVARAAVAVTQPGQLLEGALGPMFLDEERQIISWWRGFDVASDIGLTQVEIEAEAPAGAAFVCIGVRGPFVRVGEPTTAVYTFSELSLDRKA